jgi:hypothetical protein
MILRLVALIVRALLEVAAVTLVIGLLVAVLAFRIGKRLVSDKPDRLDRLSGQIPWPVLAAFRAVDMLRTERVDSEP